MYPIKSKLLFFLFNFCYSLSPASAPIISPQDTSAAALFHRPISSGAQSYKIETGGLNKSSPVYMPDTAAGESRAPVGQPLHHASGLLQVSDNEISRVVFRVSSFVCLTSSTIFSTFSLFLSFSSSNEILKATGEAQYTDDIASPPGTHFAALVLSHVAHGRIKRVDITEAEKIEGFVAYIDANCVPGKNEIGPVVPDEVLFATDEVRLYFI